MLSSGSYHPSAFAFSTQPSTSASFSRAPGRSTWSISGIPSSIANTRPQLEQWSLSSLSSTSRERQTGQRRISKSAASMLSRPPAADQRERHLDHRLEVGDGDVLVRRVDLGHPVREVHALRGPAR